MFQKSLRRGVCAVGTGMEKKGMCVRDGRQDDRRTCVKILLKSLRPGLRLLNKILFKRSTTCVASYIHCSHDTTIIITLSDLPSKSSGFPVCPSFKEKVLSSVMQKSVGVDNLMVLKKGK